MADSPVIDDLLGGARPVINCVDHHPDNTVIGGHEHFSQVVRKAASAPLGDLFLVNEKWRIPLVTAPAQSCIGLEILLLDTRVAAGQSPRIGGLLGNSGSRWGSLLERERDHRRVERGLEPMVLANVFQQFMADRPTHAVENHQQHTVIGPTTLATIWSSASPTPSMCAD